ncbi:MAG: TolC family protein [Acidobacteriota bacterium]
MQFSTLSSDGVRRSIATDSLQTGLRQTLLLSMALLLAATLASPALASEGGTDGAMAVPTYLADEEPQALEIEASTEEDGDAFRLELDDALLYALRHNVGLVVERFSRERSLLGIREAYGIYDLDLQVDLSTSSSTRPPTTVLEEVEDPTLTTDSDDFDVTLQQLTPWGGGARLTLTNSRTESSNLNVQPNPQYVSNFTLGFTQPLMRNFGRLVTERDLIVSRIDATSNLQDFRDEVQTVVEQVSDFYWDLVEAKEQLAVAEESLSLAQELHEMNRIQVEVGTKAPLELVQSEVGMATREEDIIRRRATVEDVEDQIRRLLNLDEGVLWELPIVPVTDPEIEHAVIDVPAAVDIAYRRRVDVLQRRLINEIRRIDAQVAINRTKPQLDINTGIGYNGVAGDLELVDGDGNVIRQSTNLGDALEQIIDRDFESWSVSLTFAYPLQNRAAKARAAQAELFLEQGLYELRDLEDQVRVDVRRAARAVETAAKAIESARVSSKLARKNLEAEQKRYENGLSTSFQVLEIQEDLSEAQSREISAVIAYRKALVDFQRATGQLLEAHSIQLEADTEPLAAVEDVELPDLR